MHDGRLGSLSVDAFMRDYWHRKPVLLRGALADVAFPIGKEELLDMACGPERISRAITAGQQDNEWSVEFGPFEAEDLIALPARDWTLLVQETDRGRPDLVDLMRRFRFIPNWRLDDIQISLAVPGGSAGPHLDQYDVFLIQSHGCRVWQLESAPAVPDRPIRPGLDLALLQDFKPDVEYRVEPGDILYLPPRIPHWGIAEDECLTYSVGFRTPEFEDILIGCMEAVGDTLPHGEPFMDARSTPASDPGRVDASVLSWVHGNMRELLQNEETIERLVCRHLSRSTGVYFMDEPESEVALDSNNFEDQELLLERTAICLLMYRDFGRYVCLFGAGHEYVLPPRLLPFVQLVTGTDKLSGAALAPYWSDQEAMEVLRDLVARSILYIVE